MGREVATHLDDPAVYAERYRTIVAEHEAQRGATYRREQRWPDAPFWARRHAGHVASALSRPWPR